MHAQRWLLRVVIALAILGTMSVGPSVAHHEDRSSHRVDAATLTAADGSDGIVDIEQFASAPSSAIAFSIVIAALATTALLALLERAGDIGDSSRPVRSRRQLCRPPPVAPLV
ncbi:MAG: hypothetical protein AB7Q42_21080 [Acidimicrobiia bacterium]